MRITSAQQAIAAGLLKEAAEEAELTEFREDDLVCCKGAVYRVVALSWPIHRDRYLLVKRTRDDRYCRGFAPSQKLVSEVRKAVADISAICGPTRIQRVSRRRVGGYTNPDGTAVPESWSTWYEYKWVTTPSEAKKFILNGDYAKHGYKLCAVCVLIGAGRLHIPVKDGVPAV
ncbi:MAG: hypothetical protein MJZ17_05435 [Bacteroidales bacterium]|nr:hypothetical protein [Bacteroidales bacterium]